MKSDAPTIPLWLKILPTAYLAVLIPVYIVQGGLGSLLWFSDIALIGTAVALWLEHRLLAGVMALCARSFDVGWNIDFFIRLAGGPGFLGYSAYMFDASLPTYAVGWNCTNSMPATSAPARAAMPMPSPVAPAGLVEWP